MPELDISGIMGVSLEDALQRSSNQADVDGLTEEISAQQSRSRSRAAAGEPAVARERAPFLFGLEAENKPRRLTPRPPGTGLRKRIPKQPGPPTASQVEAKGSR